MCCIRCVWGAAVLKLGVMVVLQMTAWIVKTQINAHISHNSPTPPAYGSDAHTLALLLSRAHSSPPPLSLSLPLSLSVTVSLTLMHSLPLLFTLSPPLFICNCVSHSYSLSLSLSLSPPLPPSLFLHTLSVVEWSQRLPLLHQHTNMDAKQEPDTQIREDRQTTTPAGAKCLDCHSDLPHPQPACSVHHTTLQQSHTVVLHPEGERKKNTPKTFLFLKKKKKKKIWKWKLLGHHFFKLFFCPTWLLRF